ncbi:hypothetical protein [Chachezhania sediminis]|uniref:hypothetical protein n=1 Tax=Chachezhania sediminis TaxID=2599291 RepID=UPI00131D217C|nr:hypothetical protein [Chachezhania sediminis]
MIYDDVRDDTKFTETLEKSLEISSTTHAIKSVDLKMDENAATVYFAMPAPPPSGAQDDPGDCSFFIGDADFQESQVRH